MLRQSDLEELVERCRSKNSRSYLQEAVDAYRAGAYRACIIATWIALVYDIIDKLRELAFTGDRAASAKVSDFDEIQKRRDTDAALAFERDVLRLAKDDFELISAQEHADLARLLEDRNRCGHPNLNRDTEIYSPPPELARLHLRTLVEHVLERPPVQGKAAIGLVRQAVDSDYFPTTIEEALLVLKATPLVRARTNLVKDFTLGGTISLMREDLPAKQMLQRLAALRACDRMHPKTVQDALKEKFDESVFRSPDGMLGKILWLLVVWPDCQALLKQASLVRLQNYVRDTPSLEAQSLLSALQISSLNLLAKERLERCSSAELIGIVAGVQKRPPDDFIAHCITTYRKCRSWDSANAFADGVIEPLVRYFSKTQALAVLEAATNGEVRNSFRFINVAIAIKQSGVVPFDELRHAAASAGADGVLSGVIAQP